MDETQALECTQALPLDWDEDEHTSGEKQIVAWLEIDGTRHDIFEGETKIGRDPASCQIVLQNKVLSKEHAMFEVEDDTHTLADLGSMNKTRIGKMVLKPKVRYALQGEDQIRFGDIKAKYIIKEKTVIDDSGSETGSESMLFDQTEERSASPILSHHLPGLDTTNNSCATPKTSQGKPQDLSDFIPETPVCRQNVQKQNSLAPSTSGLKTIIPESPLASQSTPLPHKVKSSVPESPANISVIQNMSIGISEDDDSFFFDPSQPTKKKIEKEKENDEKLASNTDLNQVAKVNVCAKIDDKVTEEEEDDIPTQMFEDYEEIDGEKKEDGESLDKSHKKVAFKIPEESTDNSEEKTDAASDRSTDDEDFFNQPTQAFEESDKKVVSKDESISANNNTTDDEDFFNQPTQAFEESDKNVSKDNSVSASNKTTDDEDIFNQPTQAFTEVTTPVRKDIDKVKSSTQGDHDDTQDIMEAFDIAPVKSKNLGDDDDTDDESLIPTQPFEGKRKPSENQNDDDDVPTQLFLDDEDEVVFKKPFTTAPKVKKNTVTNSKDAKGTDQEMLDTPTQPYSCHDLEAPTQAFDDLPPTQKFDPLKEPLCIQKQKQEEDDDTDVDEYFNQPTQLFVSKEQAEGSDMDGPTQQFDEMSVRNVSKDNDDDIDDFFNEPTQAFIAPEDKTGVDFDAPTQAFTKVDNDDEVDFEAPTQAFTENKVDAKANESGAISEEDDVLPPTQIFTAPSPKVLTPKRDVVDDCLAPTQPFSTPNVRPNMASPSECAPTQIFQGESDEKEVDWDAPTQAFQATVREKTQALTPKKHEEEDDSLAPTQVFTHKAAVSTPEVSASAPTQVIPDDGADGKEMEVDWDAPTQAFQATVREKTQALTPKKHEEEDDSLAPTQVFTHKAAVSTPEVSASAPTQVIPDDGADGKEMEVDWDAPTQAFQATVREKTQALTPKKHEEEDDSLAPTQVFTHKAAVSTPEVSASAPTQVIPDDGADGIEMDWNVPTQVFQEESTIKAGVDNKEPQDEVEDILAPTQIFEDAAHEKDVDYNAPTQVFTAEEKDIPKKEPPKGINEMWDKLDADATQDINIDTVIGIDEVHSGNVSEGPERDKNSNVPNSSEENLSAKEGRKDVCQDDDDNSSTASENLLQQADQEEENYYSDESTDIEDELLPPTDTKTPKTNVSCNLQESHMSRLELSSESDTGNVTDNKNNASFQSENVKSEESTEVQKEKGTDDDTCEPRMKKSGISFKRVSKIKTESPNKSGRSSIHSPSTQDSGSVPGENIRFIDSDSDVSTPQKVEGVADLASDSETDEDIANVSQVLFEITEEVDVIKEAEKPNDVKSKSEEEFNKKQAKQREEITTGEKQTSKASKVDNNQSMLSTCEKSNKEGDKDEAAKQGGQGKVGRSIRKLIDSEESDGFSGFSSSPDKRLKHSTKGKELDNSSADTSGVVEEFMAKEERNGEPEENLPKRRGRRAANESASKVKDKLPETKSGSENKSKETKEEGKLDRQDQRIENEKKHTKTKESDNKSTKENLKEDSIDGNSSNASVTRNLDKAERLSETRELKGQTHKKQNRNTRRTLAGTSGMEIKKSLDEQSIEESSNEVSAVVSSALRGRGTRNRRSLNMPSSTEQRTSGRRKKEPNRYSPDKDIKVSGSSTDVNVNSRERTTADTEFSEESIFPLTRTKRSKNESERDEIEIQNVTASQTSSKEVTETDTKEQQSTVAETTEDSNSEGKESYKKGKVDEQLAMKPPKRGRRSVPVTSKDKSNQQNILNAVAEKDNGRQVRRGRRTMGVISEDCNMKESVTTNKPKTEEDVEVEVSLTSRRGRKSEIENEKAKELEQKVKENLEKVVQEKPIVPSKRGRRLVDETEKTKEIKPEVKENPEKAVQEKHVEPRRRGRNSVAQTEKSRETKPELQEDAEKMMTENHVELPSRGRRSTVTRSKKVEKQIEDKETQETEEKVSLAKNVETKRGGRRSAASKLKEDKNENTNKSEESEDLSARLGKSSAVSKSKTMEIDSNVSTGDAADKGQKVEPSRRARRSAVQRPTDVQNVTEGSDNPDSSQEKTNVAQKRGRRWVVSSTNQEDADETSNKRSKLIMTFKAKESDSQEEASLPRRVRKSIATAHPATMEVPSSAKQTRLSMIPEKLEEESSKTSRAKRGKRSQEEEQARNKAKDENTEVATGNRRKLKQAEESSDSEHCSKRSSSQDSQGSGGRKRLRLSSNSSEDLHSTPKASRIGRSKMSSPLVKDILWSPSQRQQYADVRPKVLFTGYKDEKDEKIVVDLGGLVVESPRECSVLVTLNVRRTCKLLAVIGKGLPIVTPQWLVASKQARNFVDPWKYLVKDTESEKKFNFRLEQSLQSAKNSLIFEGLSLHATKSVKPPPDQMKEIIECSGGIYLDTPPKRYSPEIRVISCPEDKNQWNTYKRLKIPVLGTEFILTGLLRHQLLLDDYQLA